MSDLFEDPAGDPAGNAPEFTVSEISGTIKKVIEGEFSHVRIRGEVGRVSRPRSGHVYLDLKDDRAVLSGVIWKGVAGRLATRPEEGLEVVATGRLTTFPGQSKYQIVIEDIAPAGLGALMAMLEKRKAALAAEGLFDAARKKPIPFLPEIIGVVTSPSGAVIRDILHRLRDRFPSKVLVWPVAVQGARCAEEVARAIHGFNAMTPGGALPRPDLLIVARGGGSIEDLWGFNEEIVARAAAASDIPLISAVGHETDTTLIDFVSDIRAPTPTAAAEIAVPVRMELLAQLDATGGRLTRAATQATGLRAQRLRDLARALPRPDMLLSPASQRLDIWAERLPGALRAVTQRRRVVLSDAGGALRPGLLSAALRAHHRQLAEAARRLPPALDRSLRDRRRALDRTGPNPAALAREVEVHRKTLDRTAARFAEIARADVARRRDRLAQLERLRTTLGYEATLQRGYAVVRGDGDVVTTRSAAAQAARLEIQFADGRLDTVPADGTPPPPAPPRDGGDEPAPKAKPKPKPKPKADPKTPPEQGSLF